MRVSVAFAIGLGRYLSGFAEFIELRLKASTRLNHGRIIWMRRAACHARFGSRAAVADRRMARPVYPQLRKYPVRFVTYASCQKATYPMSRHEQTDLLKYHSGRIVWQVGVL